jgi:hypothetical protein
MWRRFDRRLLPKQITVVSIVAEQLEVQFRWWATASATSSAWLPLATLRRRLRIAGLG